MRTSIIDPDFDSRVTLPLPARPLLLELNEEDFARGYVVAERPPSPVAPEPAPPRRSRVGVVLLCALIVVLAAVALEGWLRPGRPSHSSRHVVDVEVVQPRPVPTPVFTAVTAVSLTKVPVAAPLVAPKRVVALAKPKSYGIDEAGF